jgi:hypothetical protein
MLLFSKIFGQIHCVKKWLDRIWVLHIVQVCPKAFILKQNVIQHTKYRAFFKLAERIETEENCYEVGLDHQSAIR